MDTPLFTGVCTALVTPFDQGRVDGSALRRLIRRQLEEGVSALLVCGTTGESSTLSPEEWEYAVKLTVDTVQGRVPVIAGTGTNDLRRTLRRGRLAADLGADAQLVVTPYYNKTTQDGLVDYYTQVAEDSRLPLILYNVPGRTGLNMRPETVLRLAGHPRVAGVKEASGDLAQLAVLAQSGAMPVYCGSDSLNAAALQLGAAGVISVLSNVVPQDVAQQCAALKKGCVATVNARQRALNPLIDALFAETSPAPVKAALGLMGLCSAEVRSPLVPVRAETLHRLRTLLAQEVMA
ncbi:MAG: 4-hydroxy-tetrahydrodipicolinate synthase [Clostridia bacterium]|nr:4-hydroxy-tetrahydrodipicolinate synthase [Clostridia bacterium]